MSLHKRPSHGHGHGGHHDTRHNQSSRGHHRSDSGEGSGIAAETTLHQKGMTRREPNAVDASTQIRGPTVDEGATRGGTAPTPGTLGPRSA
jgi:hypothetical protein